MAREISPERKTIYYIGMGLLGFGVLLSCLPFIVISLMLIGVSSFTAAPIAFFFSFLGTALLIGGAIMMYIGRAGLAGSGIILDPKRAREDVEPFSRMGGGILKDGLDEAGLLDENGLKLGRNTTNNPEKIVMIRCQNCGKLNEEDSKFCQECGTKI